MVGLFLFNNGDKVQTLVSEFEGVITGRTDYLNGGNRYFLTPLVDENGNMRDGYWFEEGDIVLIKAEVLKGDSPVRVQLIGKGNNTKL